MTILISLILSISIIFSSTIRIFSLDSLPISSITTEPTPVIEPIEVPDIYIPETLKTMSEYNYIKNSITWFSTKQLSLDEMNKIYKPYGRLVNKGMPFKEYKDTMSYLWEDCTNAGKKWNTEAQKTLSIAEYD